MYVYICIYVNTYMSIFIEYLMNICHSQRPEQVREGHRRRAGQARQQYTHVFRTQTICQLY